jgi:hypothetical protein
VARLGERKDTLQERVGALEQQLDRLAAETSQPQPDASQDLREAVGGLRDRRTRDKIKFSKEVLRRGSEEQVQAFENDISADLERLRDDLREAAAAMTRGGGNPETDALDRAQRLARGLDSLERRVRDRDEAGERDENAGREHGEGAEGERPGEAGARGGAEGEGPGEGAAGRADGAQGASPGESPQPGGRGGAGTPSSGGARRADGRDGGPGNYSPEAIRQFRGEFRRWSAEAESLRRDLRARGEDTAALDAVLKGLRELDAERVFNNPTELARLQSAVTEGAKHFEYSLRRRAGGDAAPTGLTGADEVPEQFRPLVEEYYRALATSGPQR